MKAMANFAGALGALALANAAQAQPARQADDAWHAGD